MIISRGAGSTKRSTESRRVIRMGRVPKFHLRAKKKKKKITFVSTSTCSQSDEAQQAEGGGEGR